MCYKYLYGWSMYVFLILYGLYVCTYVISDLCIVVYVCMHICTNGCISVLRMCLCSLCRLLNCMTDLLDCIEENTNVVLSGSISELEENLTVSGIVCVQYSV